MSGDPVERDERGVHGRLGCVQPRLPLSLHKPLAQDQAGLPPGQHGVGVSKVRPLKWEPTEVAHDRPLRLTRRERRRVPSRERRGPSWPTQRAFAKACRVYTIHSQFSTPLHSTGPRRSSCPEAEGSTIMTRHILQAPRGFAGRSPRLGSKSPFQQLPDSQARTLRFSRSLVCVGAGSSAPAALALRERS